MSANANEQLRHLVAVLKNMCCEYTDTSGMPFRPCKASPTNFVTFTGGRLMASCDDHLEWVIHYNRRMGNKKPTARVENVDFAALEAAVTSVHVDVENCTDCPFIEIVEGGPDGIYIEECTHPKPAHSVELRGVPKDCDLRNQPILVRLKT